MEKKSFIVHYDKRAMFDLLIEKMPDGSLSYESFGRLFAALMDYAEYGKTSVALDKVTMMAFVAMTTQMDADAQRYAQRCEANKANINKRWQKNTTSNEDIQTNTNGNEADTDGIRSYTKNTDTDTDTETDTETDTVTDTDTETDTVTDTVTDTETEKEKRDITSCTPSESSFPPPAESDPFVHSCGDERPSLSKKEGVVKASRKKDGDSKKYDEEIGQIIDHLNRKTGSNYKASTQATRRLIESRLKEGFTVEQFKSVIDKKVMDWSRDEKMAQYLRPETLFGSKFDSYLNAPAPVKTFCEHEGEIDWTGIF